MDTLISEILKGPPTVGILPHKVGEKEFYLEPPPVVEPKIKEIQSSNKQTSCSVCKMAKTKCCFTTRKLGCDRCLRLGRVCHSGPIYQTNLFPVTTKHNGKQCYRNSRCIRHHKHPGHCKVF
jgi:late competence protein required for DNA uptake (superfamily II DNA/RNA helicase)